MAPKRTLSMDSSKERAIKDALQLFAEGRIKALIRAGWREANATERALGARLVRRTGELAGCPLMQRGHLITLDGAEFTLDGAEFEEAKEPLIMPAVEVVIETMPERTDLKVRQGRAFNGGQQAWNDKLHGECLITTTHHRASRRHRASLLSRALGFSAARSKQYHALVDAVITKVNAMNPGRGASTHLKPPSEKDLRLAVKDLCAAATGNESLAELMSALQMEASPVRDRLLLGWSHLSEVTRNQRCSKLLLVMKACCIWGSNAAEEWKQCPGMEVLRLAQVKAKQTLKPVAKTKMVAAAWHNHKELFGPDVGLPTVVVEEKPSFQQRMAVVARLMCELRAEFNRRLADGGCINPRYSPKNSDDGMWMFKFLAVLSHTVPPIRTTPWATLTVTDQVPSVFLPGEELKVDFAKLVAMPAYLVQSDQGKWGLSQPHTKPGCCPWTPLPDQIQPLLQDYLDLLEAGYRLYKQDLVGSAVFPSRATLKSKSPAAFGVWERANWKLIGLPGATLMNARHALAAHLVQEGITPTAQPDLADSFAVAMQTSTRHIFGEKRGREWGLGAYNRPSEAGCARRAEAALVRYTSWVPWPGSGRKRRATAAASLAKKKKKKK